MHFLRHRLCDTDINNFYRFLFFQIFCKVPAEFMCKDKSLCNINNTRI